MAMMECTECGKPVNSLSPETCQHCGAITRQAIKSPVNKNSSIRKIAVEQNPYGFLFIMGCICLQISTTDTVRGPFNQAVQIDHPLWFLVSGLTLLLVSILGMIAVSRPHN